MTILKSDSRAHQEYYNLMYKMLEPYEEKAKLFDYTFNPKELNKITQETESAYKEFQEARKNI